MLALAGLHFQEKGSNRRFKAGGASSRGDPSLVLWLPLPPGCRLTALEPRAQSEVLRAGSRGLRSWETNQHV